MQLIVGKSYNGYTYNGIITGDFICDVCGLSHYTTTLPKLYLFIRDNSPDDVVKIGTTCITKNNFYTQLLGINK